MKPSAQARFALLSTLTLVTLLIAGFGGVYEWVWCPIAITTIAAALVLMILQAATGQAFTWDPIFLPAIGFFLLGAAAWAWSWSADRAATLTGLLQLAGFGALLYLATCAFREPVAVGILGAWAWLGGGILGFEAIAQAFTANKQIYWFHDAAYAMPIGPFVYHNHFAGCAELLLPLGYVYAFRRLGHGSQWQGWLRRGIGPALLIAALVVSASRGGLVIALLELITIAFWLRLRHQGARTQIQPIWAVAGLALLAILLVGWGPMARRLGVLGGHDASVQDRFRVSLTCVRIFASRPWVGTGFATFADVYPAFQSFDNGLRFLEAHDEYAQTLAETGLVGAVMVVAFLSLYLAGLWGLGSQTAGFEVRLRRAAAVGAAALLVHSAFDFQFHAPANAALFFVLVMASRSPLPTRALPERSRVGAAHNSHRRRRLRAPAAARV